jgi:hypothetical protein
VDGAALVGHQAGRVDGVAVQEVERPTYLHGDARAVE